jgi:plastocyanin
VLALLFVSVSALAASPSPPQTPIVTIENFTFKPSLLTVHAGTRVTFKNADDIPHSVVLTDGSFHSRALDTDESVTVPFPRPGEYAYFCGLHPHMQGTVKVIP